MTFNENELYFLPLGGSEQFGCNLNVYAYQGKILLIDCGIGFADESMPGVDILLPDPAFLEDQSKNIVGLVVTHAHEDHIGAVAYLWERFRCPVYCTPFTANILREKLNEKNVRDVPVHLIKPDEEIQRGPFTLNFASVSHSVPQAVAVFIETDLGRIVHSGDWNLDPAPVLGKPTDPAPFREIGEKGVLAYIGDSTNAEVHGTSGSESAVAEGLAAVFKEQKGRIAVTMFASNVGRVRSIAEAAKASGRKVCVVGRSLHRMIGAAIECGLLGNIAEFLDVEELKMIPPENTVLIVTGSQGEARAALARIARGDHDVSLGRGDTVIFSARAIPGNEKDINTVKNNLVAGGVKVIDPRDTSHVIHVSGHPAREEILEMFLWTRPQTVIPVHGERTQLEAHAELARTSQIKNVVVPTNGAVIRLAPGTPEIVDHVETGILAVEPGRIVSGRHRGLIERRKMQHTGVVHATIVLNKNGDTMAAPAVSFLGLIDQDHGKEHKLVDKAVDQIEDILDDIEEHRLGDDTHVSEQIRIGLRRFVQDAVGLKPHVNVHLARVK